MTLHISLLFLFSVTRPRTPTIYVKKITKLDKGERERGQAPTKGL
jgi:hypothetical protein